MSNKIIIAGMGTGGIDNMTIKVYEKIKEKKKVYTRTKFHKAISELEDIGIIVSTFDDYYEKYETFDEIYKNISDKIIEISKEEEVIFLVPGNPMMGERVVENILSNQKLDVDIYQGTSFIDVILSSLKLTLNNNYFILDATLIHNTDIDNKSELIIYQPYNNFIASTVKLKLMNYYNEDHEVTIIKNAGDKEEEIIKLPLYKLDRYDGYDHLTSIYVPCNKKISENPSFYDYIRLLEFLRENTKWVAEQDKKSLISKYLEEVLESVKEIHLDNNELLKLELGDVIWNVFMQIIISEEEGYFDFNDVIKNSYQKFILKHNLVENGQKLLHKQQNKQ